MAQLDEYKQVIVNEYRSTNRNIFVSATAGCLGKDVKVLMFDGSTKLSQEICAGDVLMGPDSCPRNVLKIDSGISNLYEVSPKKGEKWICNDEHIFTVHDQYITRSMRLYNSEKTSDIVDKHIKEILKFQKNNGEIGHLKLVRTGVEFKEKDLPIDPYLLGLWLAEGTKHKGNPYFSICKQDSDIIDYLLSYPLPKGIECKIKDDSENCVQVRFVGDGSKNIFREEFKKCIDELGNVFIPQDYLINSMKNRLRLLAGLIDGDGYKKSDGCCFSISTKWESLGEGIVYLVRSLGLYSSYKWKRSTIKSRNFEAYYFRIGISGHTEIIPNVLSRKRASKRKQIKDVLHTGFSLKPIGKGAWFGFTVDGDNRYLLGDFTITHNSGKTFTLCKLAEMTPPIKSSIFLAFNKSIAEELGRRLPNNVKASTLHSYSLSALCKAFSLDFRLNDSKNFSLAKEKMDFKGIHPKRIPGIIMKVCKLYDLMRFNLVPDNIEAVIALAERYGEEADEELAKRAIELRMLNKRIADNYFLKGGGGKLPMDFTDMLYYATQYVHKEDFKQYNVVFLDEAQDVTPLQYEIVKAVKTPRGRLIGVGDEKQCQPAGTKILMDDGTEKNIEDIQIGDTVVTYSSSRGTFLHYKTYSRGGNLIHKGDKVLAKEERYVDRTVKIRTSSGKESEYSLEHICYAKLDYDGFNEVFCTYLMEDSKGRFRVGKTNIKQRGRHSGFGLKMRMRNEGCVKAWILDTFETDREAYLMEQIVSYKFGIPQICFSGNEEEIDLIYSCIPDIRNRAVQCLHEFHRLIEYPFVTLNDNNHYSKLHSFTINACNLLPKIMQVNVFYENNKRPRTHGKNGDINYTLIGSCYETIEEISILEERKKVYSLEIENHHNYVADKILTHNCIYSFMGSNLDSLQAIKNSPNTVTLPLSMTYRCAESIVDEACKVFHGGIVAAPGAPKGLVGNGTIYEAREGDFILCRNNAPLVDAFISLIRNGKKCSIIGKEFGDQLVSLIDSVDDIFDLEKILLDLEEKLSKKGLKNPTKTEAYDKVNEKVNVLLSLYEYFGSLDKVRSVIYDIFVENASRGIILSTIHKSKGLEADRVFFLEPGLIPSKYAVTELAVYAEKCLKFVGITRARKELIYC